LKKHIKIYHDFHGIDYGDWIGCRVCGTTAQDIHHIEPKGMGGRPNADTPDNLIALCRSCHEKAHANILTKEYLKQLINEQGHEDNAKNFRIAVNDYVFNRSGNTD
jgi:5-methylcytosine-specific restriction endonuclease McrA